MNLFAKLREREAQGRPLRVGIIGAGKFGAMYIAQVPRTPGVHLAGIADLSPANARASLERVGWKPEQYAAASLDAALKERRAHVSDDWRALVAHPAVEIVVEATGNPIAAVEHALAAFRNGKHVVMVTVEADALCGPLLAKRAKEAGVVYSLAYGDQPASIEELPAVMRPKPEGGQLHHKGQVEVVSSLDHDGRTIPYDIRFGVWVVFEGESEYVRRCFTEYGVRTDPSGRYAAMYKRWHLIGLEVGISVASVGLRGEPTGCATGFRADAVASAKRDLKAGEVLDGEGGYMVVGRLMPAADSLRAGALPLGLAQQVKLVNPVKAGRVLCWADVAHDAGAEAVRVRREMESMFFSPKQRAA